MGYTGVATFNGVPGISHATDSLVTMHWYVSNQAIEGKDYDVDRLVAFWDVTNRQDITLCTMNQQGVNSRGYTPGPCSPSEEDDIDHLLSFYINTLREDRSSSRDWTSSDVRGQPADCSSQRRDETIL